MIIRGEKPGSTALNVAVADLKGLATNADYRNTSGASLGEASVAGRSVGGIETGGAGRVLAGVESASGTAALGKPGSGNSEGNRADRDGAHVNKRKAEDKKFIESVEGKTVTTDTTKSPEGSAARAVSATKADLTAAKKPAAALDDVALFGDLMSGNGAVAPKASADAGPAGPSPNARKNKTAELRSAHNVEYTTGTTETSTGPARTKSYPGEKQHVTEAKPEPNKPNEHVAMRKLVAAPAVA